MLIKTLSTIAVLLFAFSFAGAEMYRWVNEKGVVTFKDTPPPASTKRKTYSDKDFAPAPSEQSTPKTDSRVIASSRSTASKEEGFTGTVEMYVTAWCGYCKKAEKYMKGNGIPYIAYDIEKDSAAKKRYQELGGKGVPFIVIGSNKMSGFSPETLEYYLKNTK